MPDNVRPKNLEFIGSLRGLAGLWIVLYHAHFLPTPNPSRPLWAGIFVDVGGMAVMLFFVISAFSLMYTYPNRLKSKRPRLDFYLHRFFRIAPLYYVTLCFYLLHDRFQLNYQHPDTSIISNLTFTFNLIPGQQTAIVWAGWSVGVEIMFYLLFPFVFNFCKTLMDSIRVLIASLVMVNLIKVLLPYLINDKETLAIYQQWIFVRYLPVFAIGIVLYKVWENPKVAGVQEETKEAIGFILSLISGFLLLSRPTVLGSLFGDDLYLQAFAFALLVLGLSMAPLRMLVNPFLNWYGKLSFSIYLIQPIIIWHMRHLTAKIYEEVGNTIGFFVTTLMILFTLSLTAWISEFCIERPMIHLGKRISKSIAV
jgi:peptidoglycan/LPS O-acetylase OafA/YrhL